MPKCIHCGAECSFDPNIRHVCAGLQEEWKDIYNARPDARWEGSADIPGDSVRAYLNNLPPQERARKEAEAASWNLCHYNNLMQKILGGVSITLEEARSCEDRRAMRRLVRDKLQPLGDALLAEMEKHQPAEETT